MVMFDSECGVDWRFRGSANLRTLRSRLPSERVEVLFGSPLQRVARQPKRPVSHELAERLGCRIHRGTRRRGGPLEAEEFLSVITFGPADPDDLGLAIFPQDHIHRVALQRREATGLDDRMPVLPARNDLKLELGLVDRGLEILGVVRRVVTVQSRSGPVSGEGLALSVHHFSTAQHGAQGFPSRVNVFVEVGQFKMAQGPGQRLAERLCDLPGFRAPSDLGEQERAMGIVERLDPLDKAEIDQELWDRDDALRVFRLAASFAGEAKGKAVHLVPQPQAVALQQKDLFDPCADRQDDERHPVNGVAHDNLAGFPAAVLGRAARVDGTSKETREPFFGPGHTQLGLRDTDIERIVRSRCLDRPLDLLVGDGAWRVRASELGGRLEEAVKPVAVAAQRRHRQPGDQLFDQKRAFLEVADIGAGPDGLGFGLILRISDVDLVLLRKLLAILDGAAFAPRLFRRPW